MTLEPTDDATKNYLTGFDFEAKERPKLVNQTFDHKLNRDTPSFDKIKQMGPIELDQNNLSYQYQQEEDQDDESYGMESKGSDYFNIADDDIKNSASKNVSKKMNK